MHEEIEITSEMLEEYIKPRARIVKLLIIALGFLIGFLMFLVALGSWANNG